MMIRSQFIIDYLLPFKFGHGHWIFIDLNLVDLAVAETDHPVGHRGDGDIVGDQNDRGLLFPVEITQ